MSDSIQKKLSRVRKPRVQITYDVETEGATEQKELPFVVGVMGDYSGDATKPKAAIKDRKFVQIDRDNFDHVLNKMNPGLNLKVDNTLEEGDSQMSVDLEFHSMDDFEPGQLIEQVEPLKKLAETRDQLRDLLTKADRSDGLEQLLEQVLSNSENLQKLSDELGIGAEDSDSKKSKDKE